MKDPTASQLAGNHEAPNPPAERSHEVAGQGSFDCGAPPANPPSSERPGGGIVPRIIEELTEAEACWETIAGSLAASRPEDLPGWFGYYRVATLDGSTLTVHLEDSPVRDGLWRTVGRTAGLTKERYGEELARLWREFAEDECAVLELVPHRPQGGPR
jgi:hypothetical protein